jgi:hypothetical protein
VPNIVLKQFAYTNRAIGDDRMNPAQKMRILSTWVCILRVRWQKAFHLPIVRMCFRKRILLLKKC